jgi:branched-chain amino acid transport system substrate-binding protein
MTCTMMTCRLVAAAALSLIALGGSSTGTQAQEKIKVGIISDFTGPFAVVGVRLKQGMEIYLAEHGTRVGGREVELVYRDVGNGSPTVAKQIAEELIVRDRVALLAGFSVTPEVSAVASVITEAKVPAVIMVPSTPALMKMSPLFRAGRQQRRLQRCALPPVVAQNRKRRAYIVVADFAPGHQVQETFRNRFMNWAEIVYRGSGAVEHG